MHESRKKEERNIIVSKKFEKSLFVGRYQHYYSESWCFILFASCGDRGCSRKLVSSIGLYCSSSSIEERALRPGNETRKQRTEI